MFTGELRNFHAVQQERGWRCRGDGDKWAAGRPFCRRRVALRFDHHVVRRGQELDLALALRWLWGRAGPRLGGIPSSAERVDWATRRTRESLVMGNIACNFFGNDDFVDALPFGDGVFVVARAVYGLANSRRCEYNLLTRGVEHFPGRRKKASKEVGYSPLFNTTRRFGAVGI